MTPDPFTQSRHSFRKMPAVLASIDRFQAMDRAYGQMLVHGLHGGPEYDLARDRFNAMVEATRDQARRDAA